MFKKIEISIQTVLLTLAILAGVWLVIQIRDILYLLFISFLLMTAIHPLILGLEKFRLPRTISIIFLYVVILGFFGISIAGSIPAIIVQSTKLAQMLPDLIVRLLPYWNIDIATISKQFAPLGENVVKVTVGIFTNIVTTLTVLIFTFYFLLERRHAEAILTDLFGVSIGKQITMILRRIELRLGAWVRGELLLMSFVGIMTYIGLILLKVEFALPLAILAAVLEIVPMIGPIISGIPAVLVGLATSPVLALSVAALYFVVQQVENNIFVPLVMKKSIGLSPIVTILSLMIGGRLGGITGAVLAVPVLLVIQVLFTTFLQTKNPSP
jgi:predicted PurR-regulated permease PerM